MLGLNLFPESHFYKQNQGMVKKSRIAAGNSSLIATPACRQIYEYRDGTPC